jgi:aminoglycoside 3-N-acetyltransferase
MRQPLSIYARALRLSGTTYFQRGLRKLRKTFTSKTATKPEFMVRRPLIESSQLEETLTKLGIKKGDSVLVHSGISNIGKVKGGIGGIFERLRERIGPQGLLLFPAFPFGTLMHSYLETAPSFDTITSPSEMGSLTEIALKDPDRLRSLHPTHSIAGFGDQSRAILRDHHLDNTPFGPHSPFWRLADAGGKIVVMGVGLGSVTGFHLTEDRMGDAFPVKVYLDKLYEVICHNDERECITVRTRCHDPFISRIRNCYLVEPVLLETAIYKKIQLGNHYIGVIDFKAMDSLLQKLASEQRFTIYGKIWGG